MGLFVLHIYVITLLCLNAFGSPLVPVPVSNGLLAVGVYRHYHCTDFAFMWSLIRAQDCAHAIIRIPHSHVAGIFHSDGQDDAFKLPYITAYGQCGIRVSFQEPFGREEATWQGISIAAAQLNAACARHGEHTGLAHNGGWITAGENMRLKVTLHKHKMSSQVVEKGNGTITAGEDDA